MDLIISKYTFLYISKNNEYFVYNSQSNALLKINQEIYLILQEAKIDSKKLTTLPQATIEKLREIKVVVGYNDNNKYLLDMEMQYNIQSYSADRIILVLAPTTACNFECYYCFEKNKKYKKMSEKTIDDLITFLQEFKYSGLLNLTWYGGEPLLVPSIISDILNKIKNEVPSLKMDEHHLITNGYYLDEEHTEIFKKFPLDEIQVTLDGDKNRHNKIRYVKNTKEGSYDKIIKNIETFAKNFPDTKISIRVNIDKNNKEDFKLIYTDLSKRWNNKNIIIYPGILRIEDGEHKRMGCESLLHDDIRELFFGMDELVDFYPTLSYKGCFATHVNSYIIGPEGEFYKCWNEVGDTKKIVGYIHNKKLTNQDLLNKYVLATSPFKNKECVECPFLPICTGGCAFYRLKNLYENGKFDLCSLYKKEGVLQKCLEIHYDKKYNKLNTK